MEKAIDEKLEREETLEDAAENPRPPGCIKLSDEENGYRIRVRHIRIPYQIDDKAKIVIVYRIKHRKEVYR